MTFYTCCHETRVIKNSHLSLSITESHFYPSCLDTWNLLFALYHTTGTSSHTFRLFRTGNTRPDGNSPLSGTALRDVETHCQCPVIGGNTRWRGEIEDPCEFLIGLDSSSLRSNTLIKMGPTITESVVSVVIQG
jgi:hypothetical protein